MTIGNIALVNNVLVKIEKIEYKQVTRRVNKGSLLKPKFEESHTNKLELVWWSIVGSDDGTMQTHRYSNTLDWNTMIAEAHIILTQAKKLLKKENHECPQKP